MHNPLRDELDRPAPDLPPGLADGVVTSGRRRVRRGRAALGAGAAVLAVAVGVPLALHGGHDARPQSASPPVRADAIAVNDETAVYAAALAHVDAGAGPGVRRIDVRGSACTSANRPVATCAGAVPLDAQQRAAIVRLAAPTHRVRFVDPSGARLGSAAAPFVTFGVARVHGSSARVFVQSWCGFSCVEGEGLELRKAGGRWQVTGAGSGYIS